MSYNVNRYQIKTRTRSSGPTGINHISESVPNIYMLLNHINSHLTAQVVLNKNHVHNGNDSFIPPLITLIIMLEYCAERICFHNIPFKHGLLYIR